MAQPSPVTHPSGAARPDPHELGKRLRLARRALGLKQSEVAEKLGVQRTAIGEIERGNRKVASHELSMLADIYCRDYGDFLEGSARGDPIDETDPLTLLCGKEPEIRRHREARRQIGRDLSLCRTGESLKGMLGHPYIASPPSYRMQTPATVGEAFRQGERLARNERRRLNLGIKPVGNMIDVIQSQGLWASCISLPPSVLGICIPHQAVGKALFANAGIALERRRIALAHEYVHALLEDKGLSVSGKTGPRDLLGIRADSFASGFLMPWEGIVEIMLRNAPAGDISDKELFFESESDELHHVRLKKAAVKEGSVFQDAVRVAHHFKVSYQAAVARMSNLGLLTSKATNELKKEKEVGNIFLGELGRSGYCGLPDSEGNKELRSKFLDLSVEAYARECISQGRLLNLGNDIGVDATDILRLGYVSRRN